MKKIAILMGLFLVFGITTESQAQLLKTLRKKIEEKVEVIIDQKADRNIDKVLNKADNETDKLIDDALNKPLSKSTEKEDDSKSVSQQTQSSSENNNLVLSEGLIVMSGASCADFIWFKTGSMMEFETKDGKDKLLSKVRMNVSKVYDQGGVTIADVKASDGEYEFGMNYKCAGDKMYMDFGSLINQAMQKAGQGGGDNASIQKALDNTEIGFSDGFIDFPKSMYPGQQLSDVSVTIKSSPTPQISMEIFSELIDRKVVSKEKITTPAGTFECMKISGVRKMNMKVMGINKNMGASTEYLWFAPGIGIVKQEEYDEKGKLGTSMQLTAYKL